jgi:hypothetical protein
VYLFGYTLDLVASDVKRKMSKWRWQGRGGGSVAESDFGEEKIRSAVKTVDSVDKLTEIKWCDHVHVNVDVLKATVPTALITSPVTYLIVEEGKIKLLCGNCLRQALSLRLDLRTSH